jgi:hypothetical protein
VQNEEMMKTRIVIALCPLFLFITIAYSAEQKEYVSPDGKYRAHVMPAINGRHENSGEKEIIIKNKDGKILCSKNYGSEDGEHGFGVENAVWTPDSKFFVYSMSSSGGHQPWHFPADFCSITDSSIKSLDKYVGPITNSHLEAKAPDIIKGKRMKKNIDDQEAFEVSLSHLAGLENK